jgi:hypothetical protein
MSNKIGAKPTKKLERSSVEAYTGIFVGILLGLLPMTWWIRIILFVILEVVCVDFCWRSPFTYQWPRAARRAICLAVFVFIFWKAQSDVVRAYNEDHFPPGVPYMTAWGNRFGAAEVISDQAGNPKVIGDTESIIGLDELKLQRYADDYDLWAVCFHSTGQIDFKDLPVSGSGFFDIGPAVSEIRIPWSQQFISELAHGKRGTNYVLVLVPKKIKAISFTTLREATENGSVILQIASGPP